MNGILKKDKIPTSGEQMRKSTTQTLPSFYGDSWISKISQNPETAKANLEKQIAMRTNKFFNRDSKITEFMIFDDQESNSYMITASEDGKGQIWDVASEKVWCEFSVHDLVDKEIQKYKLFSQGGEGSEKSPFTKSVIEENVSEDFSIENLNANDKYFCCIQLSENLDYLGCGATDGTIRIYEIKVFFEQIQKHLKLKEVKLQKQKEEEYSEDIIYPPPLMVILRTSDAPVDHLTFSNPPSHLLATNQNSIKAFSLTKIDINNYNSRMKTGTRLTPITPISINKHIS